MGHIESTTFVCVDCEATGLDSKEDRIIEVAAAVFQGGRILESFTSLVDPKIAIPKDSQLIHHISDEMVQGAPEIKALLPEIHRLVGAHPIVGHCIGFDVDLLNAAAVRGRIPSRVKSNAHIDTLRLARLYGGLTTNSLENLRAHFNINAEGSHRAMGDVLVTIQVFAQLVQPFQTLEQLLKRLEKPIEMKTIPLGKHKGRSFRDIPLEYLQWALGKRFDMDLQHSLLTEVRRRKQQRTFGQASNPFGQMAP